jgi:hypothetical protein
MSQESKEHSSLPGVIQFTRKVITESLTLLQLIEQYNKFVGGVRLGQVDNANQPFPRQLNYYQRLGQLGFVTEFGHVDPKRICPSTPVSATYK